MELTVIVPAYNEGQRILRNLLQTADVLRSFSTSWELIAVDDGSTDDTYTEATRAKAHIPELRILSYPKNRGKGYALSRGSIEARGGVVAFLDADLEIDPSQLPALLRILNQRPVELVIGSKKHPESRNAFPFIRRVLSECYALLVKCLFRLPVQDTQSGLKVFRRQALLDALPQVESASFAFDLDLLVQIHRKGYRIAEAPVSIRFLRPSSRVTFHDIWRIWSETVRLFYRLRAPARSRRCGMRQAAESDKSRDTFTEVDTKKVSVGP
jgi:glycosyltransferase involved in cell wall biosynthesis